MGDKRFNLVKHGYRKPLGESDEKRSIIKNKQKEEELLLAKDADYINTTVAEKNIETNQSNSEDYVSYKYYYEKSLSEK